MSPLFTGPRGNSHSQGQVLLEVSDIKGRQIFLHVTFRNNLNVRELILTYLIICITTLQLHLFKCQTVASSCLNLICPTSTSDRYNKGPISLSKTTNVGIQRGTGVSFSGLMLENSSLNHPLTNTSCPSHRRQPSSAESVISHRWSKFILDHCLLHVSQCGSGVLLVCSYMINLRSGAEWGPSHWLLWRPDHTSIAHTHFHSSQTCTHNSSCFTSVSHTSHS